MLLLVQAGNFLLLLVGWGLVGLASYLLIGFWHRRPEAVAAAKKAFVMNAVGDATMALAFFVLIQQTGTLDFAGAFAGAEGMSSTAVNLVALGLLGGAVAKSAQLPLHTWLPDAMEGPTPGLRPHPRRDDGDRRRLPDRAHAPALRAGARRSQDLAAGLGAATLLVAGLVALVQTDIKRVIAYSTMSQIGYMFLGAGLGAYGSGMFHLMTHAFFKALLFMAAGIVIHAPRGRAGHAQDGRAAEGPAAHVARLPRRLARARRRAAALRVLVEGRDSGCRSGERKLWPGAVRRGVGRRLPDRPLHVPDALPRLLGRAVGSAQPSTRTGTARGRAR